MQAITTNGHYRSAYVLGAATVLAGVLMWSGLSAPRVAYAQVPDSGSQRNEMIKELRTSNQKLTEIATCLRAGNPVVYGTNVGENWQDYQKGQVLGKPTSIEGGHATVLIGIQGQNFLGENSWGTSWGDDGFYLISPDVLTDPTLSSDFWVIQTPDDTLGWR